MAHNGRVHLTSCGKVTRRVYNDCSTPTDVEPGLVSVGGTRLVLVSTPAKAQTAVLRDPVGAPATVPGSVDRAPLGFARGPTRRGGPTTTLHPT